MDEFIRQPSEERRVYFEQTAARMRLSPQIVEKDFWVCWTLKELFGLPDIGGTLIFKGGTSLSKIYRMIERFSEDIDVSLDRGSLGFGGESDPEAGGSAKDQYKPDRDDRRHLRRLPTTMRAIWSSTEPPVRSLGINPMIPSWTSQGSPHAASGLSRSMLDFTAVMAMAS